MLPPLKKQTADICLIIEDSYPYRQGGEATWVHQFIAAMPRVKFAIVHVATTRFSRTRRGLKFKLPRNVTSVMDAFIFEDTPTKKTSPPSRKTLASLYAGVTNHDAQAVLHAFSQIAPTLPFETLWDIPEAQHTLADLCARDFPEISFVDFIATARHMLAPVWELARRAPDLPLADSYHVIGTGYAGLMGVLARHHQKKPLLLSELNITVRNRIGELLRAEWTDSPHHERGSLRHLWIEFHMLVAKHSYQTADKIVTPFQKNAHHQAEFGAASEKISLIPNGIDLSLFETVRRDRVEKLRLTPHRKTIGFLGRISAQKDLKTLIQAARITIDQIPDATFIIAGPKSDELDYYHECRQLVADLKLKKHITFPGHLSIEKALPEFDILAASSIGDGQPLSILEAFASQIPVVATDVGDCTALLNGEDGTSPAGRLVGIGDARRMATAFIELLNNPAKRNRYGTNGRERVEAHFPRAEMTQAYRDIYDEFAGRITNPPSDKKQPNSVELIT